MARHGVPVGGRVRKLRAVREQTSSPLREKRRREDALGPRSFGKTLRDLSHPLMGNNRILCSLDARCQGASLFALQGSREDENIRWVHANDGMELDTAVLAEHEIADDDAGLFDKTGRGNGGFDALIRCGSCVHDNRGIGPRPARCC